MSADATSYLVYGVQAPSSYEGKLENDKDGGIVILYQGQDDDKERVVAVAESERSQYAAAGKVLLLGQAIVAKPGWDKMVRDYCAKHHVPINAPPQFLLTGSYGY